MISKDMYFKVSETITICLYSISLDKYNSQAPSSTQIRLLPSSFAVLLKIDDTFPLILSISINIIHIKCKSVQTVRAEDKLKQFAEEVTKHSRK